MAQSLHTKIRTLVMGGRYVVGEHATQRLEERGILEWQVVNGIEGGTLIVEKTDAVPNPAMEVRQSLADGTEIKAIWSLIISLDIAKLVTVHFLNE